MEKIPLLTKTCLNELSAPRWIYRKLFLHKNGMNKRTLESNKDERILYCINFVERVYQMLYM